MAKPRKNLEGALSSAIQRVLTAKGAIVWRIQSGILPVLKGGKTAFVHCAPKGSPDLLCIVPSAISKQPCGETMSMCGPAKYIHIEVKTKTGRLSPEQVKFHQWAQANGVRSIVARSISDALTGVFGSAGAS